VTDVGNGIFLIKSCISRSDNTTDNIIVYIQRWKALEQFVFAVEPETYTQVAQLTGKFLLTALDGSNGC
jgi:hypothetical protein